MGSNIDTAEEPVHNVNVPSFEMMKTEVTVGMWKECVEVIGIAHVLADVNAVMRKKMLMNKRDVVQYSATQ